MKWPRQGFSLSIFARTFLLMIAALIVAELIGLTLLINRPPLKNAPMQLSDLARRLGGEGTARGGPPPFADEGRGPAERFGGPPPPPEGSRFGPPDDRAQTSAPSREWTLREAAAAPMAPQNTNVAASSTLSALLASRLRVAPERVRLFVTSSPLRDPDGDPQLWEGFVAGMQLTDGRWRILESVVEGFPTRFQQQALWLFVLGLLVLLPLSWFFSRALAAPIWRFTAAARRLGNDPSAPPLDREGPPEMRSAVDSFNAMQARLNRLLQERTHMIGAIAHDLRTPLTRLAFRLDDLPSPLNEKVTADIQEMKLMISAALDFIRDRSLSAQRERLDFQLLVESAVDDQSDVGQDVTLAAGEPIVLNGDPIALRRMVVNLIDNALKYGTRARLRLRIDQNDCLLDVDDDGPGIPEQLLQQVFEPFYRAEASRNRNTGGIGLGLSAARAIVLDHGGTITLRNRAGGGLRASVSLPL